MSESQFAMSYPAGAKTLRVQGLRFMVVGLVATFTHAATVVLLMDGLEFRYASLANALAVIAGSAVSYLGNHCWTFQARSWSLSRILRFSAAYAAVFLSTGVVMLIAADLQGVHYIVPLAAVLIISPIVTFLLNRFWVFADG